MQEILNNNKNFGFHDALDKMQKRPWLVDNFDEFMDSLEKVSGYVVATTTITQLYSIRFKNNFFFFYFIYFSVHSSA